MARPTIYLGLGSNLGQRGRTLDQGLERIARRGFTPRKRSSTYLTEPVGGPPQQGWYLNLVVVGETDLTPEDLLLACQETERDLGRERRERWGPRTLDIDLLLYGNEQRQTLDLVLPHAHLAERLFVLAPLEEIAPDVRHPRLGLTARELRARCPDPSRVMRCSSSLGDAR
jgi:2-amino-4-hydroxy-6-hydroxymethyldihydropteridine diphosphokinase